MHIFIVTMFWFHAQWGCSGIEVLEATSAGAAQAQATFDEKAKHPDWSAPLIVNVYEFDDLMVMPH